MKKILIIFCLFTGFTGLAQQGVKVEGNKISTRQMPPVWPGCEKAEVSKTCFKEKLTQHLKDNYKFPKDAEGNYLRGKAVVSFHINEEGKPEIISVEGPVKELNAEAKRIILSIPQMKPGELAGKPVAIKYKVPFTF